MASSPESTRTFKRALDETVKTGPLSKKRAYVRPGFGSHGNEESRHPQKGEHETFLSGQNHTTMGIHHQIMNKKLPVRQVSRTKAGYEKENEAPELLEKLDVGNTIDKLRKPPHNWTIEDELTLSSQLHEDFKGVKFPPRKGDGYWAVLRDVLRGKLGLDWSKDQIYHKYRRMKAKYKKMIQDDSKLHRYRDSNEETLFSLWRQILQNEASACVHNGDLPKSFKIGVAESVEIHETHTGPCSKGEYVRIGMNTLDPIEKDKSADVSDKIPGPRISSLKLQDCMQDLPGNIQLKNRLFTENMCNRLVQTAQIAQHKTHKLFEQAVANLDRKFQSVLMLYSSSATSFPLVEANDQLVISEFEHRWLEQLSQECHIISKRLKLQQELLHFQHDKLKLLDHK
ncbi:hypothetical protein O6H91_01G167700 [Diphasiastrum complanatum]|uniref:Uncharacterized protein n=2 Tax=Diphasiastrum complanatum TaxID=34168 RepID=A0ACC2EYR7_DIPCM|nr:hypothetical protein O6H91_01G167700 [Diphasiastrum complanatum]KAJ7571593.1 hypothetical protein O6H91_01G167700 [Diphasiastrum complanatum]